MGYENMFEKNVPTLVQFDSKESRILDKYEITHNYIFLKVYVFFAKYFTDQMKTY